MRIEKGYRKEHLLPMIFQYWAKQFAHVTPFKFLGILESGYQYSPLTENGED